MTRLVHRLDGPQDAPVLVLGNALGAGVGMWDGQMPELTGRRRVLRYEHAGHDGSGEPPPGATVGDHARDVLALLDELALERVTYCGLSLGGDVALWLGCHAPERLEGIVVSCTSAGFGTADAWRTRAQTVRRDGIEAVADMVMGRYFSEGFRERSPEVVTRFRRELVEQPAEGYARGCEALADWDFWDQLGEIAAPTLIVAGELDAAVPPGHPERMAEAIPGATLEWVPGAGHLANVEQPTAFTARLLGALRS